ncbi:MAG TPA: hypothetical protein VKC58_12840, partial [Myxococcales bacterium]|nr:hypothetical protein [Myxococcales bacterium]
LHALLRGPADVAAAVPFRDDFERATLGETYWSNGGHWRIVRGQVYSPGVGNNPLWLKARLPRDVRIEFDVRSEAPDGDIKWEAFGDGRNHATGYIFIFGGWHNREVRIAKLDEHAPTDAELRAQLANLVQPYPRKLERLEGVWDALTGPFVRASARADLDKLEKGTYYQPETPRVVKRLDLRVERGRTYHETITRRGGGIRWEQDGQLVLELDDRAPLPAAGHDRFGFSSWQNDTWFDNLKIDAL